MSNLFLAAIAVLQHCSVAVYDLSMSQQKLLYRITGYISYQDFHSKIITFRDCLMLSF